MPKKRKWRNESGSRSWEDQLAQQMAWAGIPEPVRQHRFHKTRKWRCDFCWPDWMLILEVQGMGHHAIANYLRGIERANEMAIGGYYLLQVTGRMIRNGQALVLLERMLQALGWRSDRGER